MCEDEKKMKRPIRVYFDGCFDCLHVGHANALRQAREMGDELVVGIHSDRDITKNKHRPPVCSEKERYRMVQAFKWVDEVIEGATFLPDLELLEKYNCDFCVHGDDKSVGADGGDSYRLLKAAGRYKEFQRTKGISTTDIIHRLLLRTEKTLKETEDGSNASPKDSYQNKNDFSSATLKDEVPHLLPTSKLLASFSGTEPKKSDRIVYVAGDFDLFNVGHIEFLERSRANGDYLLVGIHSDEVVKLYRGQSFPLMSLMERAMTILACKCVSEIIIGAPLSVTADLMERFKVDLVCHTSSAFSSEFPLDEIYSEPMARGKFKLLKLSTDVNTMAIVNRFKSNRRAYSLTENS